MQKHLLPGWNESGSTGRSIKGSNRLRPGPHARRYPGFAHRLPPAPVLLPKKAVLHPDKGRQRGTAGTGSICSTESSCPANITKITCNGIAFACLVQEREILKVGRVVSPLYLLKLIDVAPGFLSVTGRSYKSYNRKWRVLLRCIFFYMKKHLFD